MTKILKRLKITKLVVILGLIGLLVAFLMMVVELPNPKKLQSSEYPESSRIYDRNGLLLYEIYADKRRSPVKIDQVPKYLKEATVAIEDANFYHHIGFDIKGIGRAIYRTLFRKRIEGGSTLTQQLVKNALLTPEKTISRKVKEAFLTLATEIIYSKEQILEMYLNQTPYGGTMWGVEAAANGLFNKTVDKLDLAESAMIAGLPGSPTRYSPFAYPEVAKKRQALVLKRMVEEKYITAEQAREAENEELKYFVSRVGIEAPHFVFYVKEQLIEKYGIKKVNEGGLKVITTLDLTIEQMAEKIVEEELAKLSKLRVSNGAVLITKPDTGEILAMVGSKDYFANDIDGKFNVTTALRQPGSSIKPFNYALGIETGKVTAASVFYDGPTCFESVGQKNYCPTNYGGNYFGIQTLRNSLASSLNIPAVKMLKINGLETFVASAAAMGITTLTNPDNYGLSLTLGGGEVTMMDMATAFGTIANAGVKQNLITIRETTGKGSEKLEEYGFIPGERKLSRETAFIISQILSDDNARAMVFGRGSMLNIKGHPEVAVKTGTTNDMRDNWTIGYTPDLVVATWVGNNNNTKMGGLVSGTTGAAPIWNKIMTKILADKPIRKVGKPDGVKTAVVCNLTGMLVPEEGCESHQEYFKEGFEPKTRVSLTRNVLIDKDTGQIVKEGEEKTNVEWQNHPVVEDVTGALVCLDCPKIENGNGN
ncbi:MAG: PBP1A family penicillin-binding protein [Candidatus Shapirobacteria bacterium]